MTKVRPQRSLLPTRVTQEAGEEAVIQAQISSELKNQCDWQELPIGFWVSIWDVENLLLGRGGDCTILEMLFLKKIHLHIFTQKERERSPITVLFLLVAITVKTRPG